MARGGAGKLTDALIACIRDHGGEVLANAEVRAHQGEQWARQRRRDGRRPPSSAAKDAVIGAIHPHLLGGMIDGMDARARADAEATHITSAACITVHAALIRAAALPHQTGHGQCGDDGDAAHQLRNPAPRFRRTALWAVPALPAAGPGLAVAVRPQPRAARQGHPAPVGLRALQAPRRPQLGREQAGIRQTACSTHLVEVRREHPRRRAAGTCRQPRGHGAHVAQLPPRRPARHRHHHYQSGSHRPTPELGNNTVPGLDRFYLVGPFQYPGGGVFGAGRATPRRCSRRWPRLRETGQPA